MKNQQFVKIILPVIAVILVAYLLLTPSAMSVPVMTITDLNGKTYSLQELKGKPYIVNFWATTCPGCVKEIPALMKVYDKYKDQGLNVFGIAMSYDPESQVRAMVKDKNINYSIVLDKEAQIAGAFGNVTLTPTTFFINKKGLIQKHKLGEMSYSEIENDVMKLML